MRVCAALAFSHSMASGTPVFLLVDDWVGAWDNDHNAVCTGILCFFLIPAEM